MRADRLLSALLLLQAHGRLTSRDLARRLEVSERTMHRDMEAVSELILLKRSRAAQHATPMKEIFATGSISDKTRERVKIDREQRIATGTFRRKLSKEE